MLQEQSLITTILVNILLGAVWHYATFFICVFRDTSSFSPDKKCISRTNGKRAEDSTVMFLK